MHEKIRENGGARDKRKEISSPLLQNIGNHSNSQADDQGVDLSESTTRQLNVQGTTPAIPSRLQAETQKATFYCRFCHRNRIKTSKG